MNALVYHGPRNVSVDDVAEPTVLAPTDAIVRVTSTAICGSDLHLYNGYIPTVKHGDILGHEFMGVIESVGDAVKKVHVGDRVVVPFTIACGGCNNCKAGFTSLCDNSNPNQDTANLVTGHSPAGLYGYSHAFGGYPGGQAQHVRVVFADANVFKVPDNLTDEQVLFLTDIFPTGYQAVEQCDIKPGDVVAIWGCGPVGLFAIQSAFLLGASKVIAIDRLSDRLERAQGYGAEPVHFEKDDVLKELNRRTAGRGPDAVIDCVGMEAHAATVDALLDKVKQVAKLTLDRTHVVRQAIYTCAKGGAVSIPGVYIGFVDMFPLGTLFAKGLRLRTGQTNVQRYLPTLLDYIAKGKIKPQDIITHRFGLTEAAEAYKMFVDKSDDVQKIVLDPAA